MRLRLALASLAIAISTVFAPVSSAAALANDPACAAYPEPRAMVEIQSWWQDRVGEAFPGRHIHLAVCWPTGVVTGPFQIDPVLQAHHQPKGNYVKRVRATHGSSTDVFTPQTSGFTPLDVNGDVIQTLHYTVGTSSLVTGLNEIRLAAYVRQTHSPAGVDTADFDQLVSSDLPVFYKSMSGGETSRDYVEARSWYPGFLYTNSRYRTRLSDFLTVKSGIWQPTFECASPSGANAQVENANIDPHFHALDEGISVGTFSGEGTHRLTIDTTTLTNGVHKIVYRCAATANLSGHDGTSTGVLALNFTVLN